MKRSAIIALALLSACSTVKRAPEVYRVGELEVRLYQDREAMLDDLPAFFRNTEAAAVGGRRMETKGFFDRENKRIFCIDDARIVIHEFKHYLEPEWKHGAAGAGSESTH